MADEPTSGLDDATGEVVMELMFAFNREQGTTLVFVTHDRGIAQRRERRITIEAGRASVRDRGRCYRRNFPADVMMDRSENLKPVWLVGL